MRMNKMIRDLRLQKGLSQERLGEILGVSAQAVSKWEQNITSPDISLLPALADCFGVTIDSLFQEKMTRKYPGYGGERQELLAIYESCEGTEDDFKHAADAYSNVILSGKAGAEDYLCYGILHRIRAQRDLEKALYYYRRAITECSGQRDLQWMAAHQALTNLLTDIGRAEDAVEEQRCWCEREPDVAWAHVAYSYALEKTGQLDEAWRELEIALCLEPKDMNVLTAAGDLCARLGRYSEAIEYWDGIPKEAESISHLFSKAKMLAEVGEREKAIEQYEEILVWLEAHGYNMKLEGEYLRKQIEALKKEL